MKGRTQLGKKCIVFQNNKLRFVRNGVAIRLLQEEIYVKIQSASASQHINRKKEAQREFVVDAYKQYQDGYISRAAYIAIICHEYLPVDL